MRKKRLRGEEGFELEAEPHYPEFGPKRKCHDCGKPTYNYRCRECHIQFRIKNGVPIQDNINDMETSFQIGDGSRRSFRDGYDK